MGIEPQPQCKHWITSPTHYPSAAAPHPPDTLISNFQYDDLFNISILFCQEKNEARRRYVKSYCQEMLKSQEKPFNFSKREEEKKFQRAKSATCAERIAKSAEKAKKEQKFVARPVPDFVKGDLCLSLFLCIYQSISSFSLYLYIYLSFVLFSSFPFVWTLGSPFSESSMRSNLR